MCVHSLVTWDHETWIILIYWSSKQFNMYWGGFCDKLLLIDMANRQYHKINTNRMNLPYNWQLEHNSQWWCYDVSDENTKYEPKFLVRRLYTNAKAYEWTVDWLIPSRPSCWFERLNDIVKKKIRKSGLPRGVISIKHPRKVFGLAIARKWASKLSKILKINWN